MCHTSCPIQMSLQRRGVGMYEGRPWSNSFVFSNDFVDVNSTIARLFWFRASMTQNGIIFPLGWIAFSLRSRDSHSFSRPFCYEHTTWSICGTTGATCPWYDPYDVFKTPYTTYDVTILDNLWTRLLHGIRSFGNPLHFVYVRMLLLSTSGPILVRRIGWCHASSVPITL